MSKQHKALGVALELVDLERNGTTLGAEFPESRALIADAMTVEPLSNLAAMLALVKSESTDKAYRKGLDDALSCLWQEYKRSA